MCEYTINYKEKYLFFHVFIFFFYFSFKNILVYITSSIYLILFVSFQNTDVFFLFIIKIACAHYKTLKRKITVKSSNILPSVCNHH